MARLRLSNTQKSRDRAAFGYRLRNIREALDISQVEMAKQLKLDRSYLSDLEYGKKGISLTEVQRIARILGMDASELLKNL